MPQFSLMNKLDQSNDIAGSPSQSSTKILTDETSGFGGALAGQTGAAANITVFAAGISTLTGLTGMTADSVGNFLTVSGAASAGNNGTFLITEFVSATSVKVANSAGVAPDANNGAITWTERAPYTLLDDVNFERTDRAAIKGVSYDAAIPVYQRPTAVGTNVPANLSNIASKTTDAMVVMETRKFEDEAVAATNTFVTLTDAGNLKHADAVNRTGVPIQDGADVGAHESTYVEIINPATESALEVLTAGGDFGKRIYGRTRAGAATSPNSVEVEFRAVAKGAALSTSVAYTWEAGQPTTVDMFFGFRQRFDQVNENFARRVLVHGLVGDADTAKDIIDTRAVIGVGDDLTDLSTLLTNTGNFFPFVNLPDATPSVVEALNTLNAQIGNRDYTGAFLTDGQTITASLQALSNAIGAGTMSRYIERLAADIPANTAHTLPGGATYVIDGTFNGRGMRVHTAGVLRDPGAVVNGDDYTETSTTQVTFFARVKAGVHVNYMIGG